MPTPIKKLTDQEQKQAAAEFAERWKDRGNEKQDDQSYWNDLLHDVLGVERTSDFINYQKKVNFENSVKFADGYIKETKILIEQKGHDIDLGKAEQQSDGSWLRPDQQARRYANNLPYDEKPKYIITSNFKEIWIYDENRPHSDPEKILLKDLPKEYYRLQFIADTGSTHIKKEMELSIKAGEIIGDIYNAIRKEYEDPDDEETLKSLNKLCVRLVFCFYAEDAGLFGKKSAFHDYLVHYDTNDFRDALKSLFTVLNQKPENRDKYLKPELASFPYVNGGLFDDENIEIPQFTVEIRNLILEKASDNFNWSEISPTIFGAVFESTLNPETRRKGGMHYTSIENIHKVIDPLFYDDLCKEFEKIKSIKVAKTRNSQLEEFRDKLASLKFLDPACGSGNFLTETYLSLRHLENEAIQMMQGGKTSFGFLNPIKVQINQFYGIEINDFAVTVAKTALWIAESQMMQETERIMAQHLEFLPLKSYTNIVEGNALRIDWNDVVPADELNYIMGNPPFVGKKEQSNSQKNDLISVFNGRIKTPGLLDYVTGWYIKAFDYIDNSIDCAFVSTNSISQGEQVPAFLGIFLEMGNIIKFAYRSFRWDSEASLKAHVHCVIIGFGKKKYTRKILFDTNSKKKTAKNINAYLLDAPNIIVDSRKEPLSSQTPKINYGSMPIDNGHLILDRKEQKEITDECPEMSKYIRQYKGGDELLNNNTRYCLWLKNISPSLLSKSKKTLERVKLTKIFRENSNRPQTKELASTPTLFGEIRQPSKKMITIPKVSSENRKYIPISITSPEIIINGSTLIIPNDNLYLFGILCSNVHNSWMRTVGGRLKSDYQYSNSIVYNTFPWPTPTEKQKAEIEKTAQMILDARAKYPNSSLADLYDDTTMPPELRKAHQLNDKAVMKAYGFWGKLNSETECVAELMKIYQKLVNNEK